MPQGFVLWIRIRLPSKNKKILLIRKGKRKRSTEVVMLNIQKGIHSNTILSTQVNNKYTKGAVRYQVGFRQ